ncbi:MAG: cysteine synthase A [Flavobacteriales bacterium]
MKVHSITEIIGNTPHVRLGRLFPNHNVWIKLERQNPGASIKDRIALSMIEAAEKDGSLKQGGTIIEPTSGNTGIGISLVGAAKGYRVIVTMPESMSVERRKIMKAYGTEFVLTPKEKGMKGAIERAEELAKETDGAVVLQQFDNPVNPEIHREATAKEILNDFEQVDYLITGVGTGGHITGVSEVLKKHYSNLKTYAVEPDTSPVISGGNPGPHPIQGIGAGFIPKNLHTDTLDGAVQVTKEEAFEWARKIAKTEGIFVGISTGASLAAVSKKLNEMKPDETILTFNYDTGERYLSIEGLY